MLHGSNDDCELGPQPVFGHRGYISPVAVPGNFVYDIRYAVGMWR